MTQLALVRPRDWFRWFHELSWWHKVIVLVVGVQAVVSFWAALSFPSWSRMDWAILTDAGDRALNGLNPYGTDDFERLRFSPLLAYFFGYIEPIGFAGWTVVGFATLAILRDWRLIAAFLIALPFWADIATGMTFLPVPVLAIAALRGSFGASLGFVALAVLVPRPLMLPILGWLLWHDRRLWWPSIAIAVGLTAGALATGWLDEWILDLIAVTGDDPRPVFQPSAILGPLWLVVVAAGTWLAVRGRLGFASLAFAPYWNPSYLLLLLLELPWVNSARTPQADVDDAQAGARGPR